MSLDKLVTIDTILDWLQEQVATHQPISPHIWLDAAGKLNVLLGDEQNKLFALQQQVAKLKLQLLNGQEEINVSEAKLRVEATDEYRLMHEQKAKIERVIEQIRIAKVQARISDDEYKGY